MILLKKNKNNTSRKSFKSLLALSLLLLGMGSLTAQTYYVFYSSGYYMTVSGGALARTNTFNPSTCVWTYNNNNLSITISGTTYTLGYDRNGNGNNGNNPYVYSNHGLNRNFTASITIDNSTHIASCQVNSRSNNSGNWYTYYIRYANNNFSFGSTSNSDNAIAYQVNSSHTNAAQISSSTTVTVPSISPSSASLAYQANASFTASATATTTTVTRPAYDRYIIAFNTPETTYYANNTAYSSVNDIPNTNTTTHPTVTYAWTLSGSGNTYLTKSDNGATTTVTHSTMNTTSSGVSSTLSVRASAAGVNQNSTSNATVTALAAVNPTSITINTTSPMTLHMGETGTITYTLSPAGCYGNVTFSSSNTSVATVDGSGVVTGTGVGTSTITATAKKIDGTTAAIATINVIVRGQVATPVISFTGSGETATCTITCATSGATIHYSVNDGAYQTYSAPFTVNSGDMVKAYATSSNANYDQSATAQSTFAIETGVNGTTVTLNDLEDHTWTYYAGLDKDDGTYNTRYLGTLYSPNPRNVKITYQGGSVANASAVAISSETGENQNEMVYYKTLERFVIGEFTDANRDGRPDNYNNSNEWYPYTVIPNPFSKRPRTNGATGNNGYYGFAGWKITSGWTHVKRADGTTATQNAVLNLDEKIHFIGLDAGYTPNCISAEVVFEATWTAANVQTGTTPQPSPAAPMRPTSGSSRALLAPSPSTRHAPPCRNGPTAPQATTPLLTP